MDDKRPKVTLDLLSNSPFYRDSQGQDIVSQRHYLQCWHLQQLKHWILLNKSQVRIFFYICSDSVTSASLALKNPQRRKTWHAPQRIQRSQTIDRFDDFLYGRKELFLWLLFKDACLLKSFLCSKYLEGLYFNFSKLRGGSRGRVHGVRGGGGAGGAPPPPPPLRWPAVF